jgi:ADP-heptose:LPS heptosyltransferase
MGYGDVLMAAGHAERIYTQDPSRGPVLITAGNGKPRWNPIWERNPAIYRPESGHIPPTVRRLVFGGEDHLPYFKRTPLGNGCHAWQTDWRVRDHRPSIYLSVEELALGTDVINRYGPFILVEPTATSRLSPNRAWPIPRWQALVDRLLATQTLAVVQLDWPEATRLRNLPGIPHTSFRAACGILAASRLLVSTEGGLTIAAGALHRPAVVLASPCGPPVETIGFPEHFHLVDADPQTPCGRLTACAHCAAAWDRLSVDAVADAVALMLRDQEQSPWP